MSTEAQPEHLLEIIRIQNEIAAEGLDLPAVMDLVARQAPRHRPEPRRARPRAGSFVGNHGAVRRAPVAREYWVVLIGAIYRQAGGGKATLFTPPQTRLDLPR